MPTRRKFIGTAAVLAAAIAGHQQSAQAAGASATPSPPKTPAPSPTAPSPLAVELARWLGRTLPEAHLGAVMTAKIAKDINDNLFVSGALRKSRSNALPPPDFVFVAAVADRP